MKIKITVLCLIVASLTVAAAAWYFFGRGKHVNAQKVLTQWQRVLGQERRTSLSKQLISIEAEIKKLKEQLEAGKFQPTQNDLKHRLKSLAAEKEPKVRELKELEQRDLIAEAAAANELAEEKITGELKSLQIEIRNIAATLSENESEMNKFVDYYKARSFTRIKKSDGTYQRKYVRTHRITDEQYNEQLAEYKTKGAELEEKLDTLEQEEKIKQNEIIRIRNLKKSPEALAAQARPKQLENAERIKLLKNEIYSLETSEQDAVRKLEASVAAEKALTAALKKVSDKHASLKNKFDDLSQPGFAEELSYLDAMITFNALGQYPEEQKIFLETWREQVFTLEECRKNWRTDAPELLLRFESIGFSDCCGELARTLGCDWGENRLQYVFQDEVIKAAEKMKQNRLRGKKRL